MKVVCSAALLLAMHISTGDSLMNNCPMLKKIPASSRLMMVDVLSIAAGSIAGAVGVGFAYPLDSMKTKIQIMAAMRSEKGTESPALNSLLIARNILKDEGVLSLYKGVAGVMAGNALIKACAFSANKWALSEITTGSPSLDQLVIAASFAGLVTSFFSNPIERVKVLMQSRVQTKANPQQRESAADLSELQVISQVLRSDGLHGLAFRGLDATVAREIPGYSLYFAGYFTLMHSPLGQDLGAVGPVVMGALAGMLSWSIVFPLDVCKTNLQNIVSPVPSPVLLAQCDADDAQQPWSQSSQPNLLSTAIMLRERHGMSIFVRGMTPKMLQAGVNHAVTFYVYDLILGIFSAV